MSLRFYYSNSAHARDAAERLRGLIEGSSDLPRRATASFGVSEYRNGDGVASLVKRTDEALVKARLAGRNRVACSDD